MVRELSHLGEAKKEVILLDVKIPAAEFTRECVPH